MRQTEVGRPYQSQDCTLQSRKCLKLETGRKVLDSICVRRGRSAVVTQGRTIYIMCVERSCDLYQKQTIHQILKTQVRMYTAEWSPAVTIGRPKPSCSPTCAPSPRTRNCRPKRLETVASLLQRFQIQPAVGFRLAAVTLHHNGRLSTMYADQVQESPSPSLVLNMFYTEDSSPQTGTDARLQFRAHAG